VKTQCNLQTPLEDKLRVMIKSDALKAPISTRMIPAIQMTSNRVLSEVTKVLQSNENIPLNESFTIDLVAVRQPIGSGKSLKVLDYNKDSLVKKSIITIRNKDKLCCGRAIAVGQAMADKHPKLKQFKNGQLIQKQVALKLYKRANVLPGPCGLRDISKFQGVLGGYQIVVIDFNARNSVIYEGPRGSKKIVLYKHGDHFNVINPEKLPAFHGKRFFCEKCKSFYQDYFTHPCTDPCVTCMRKDCTMVSSEKRTCSECFKICRSDACFNHHKKSRKLNGLDLPSKCHKSYRCQTCLTIVDRERQDKHQCGESICHICKEFVLSDHLCYMQTEQPKAPNDKLIFYDFETDFSTGEHVVNFAVAQYADGTEFVFKGYDALDKFCLFVFDRMHEKHTLIAHNSKAFDGVFVQRWLIQNRPTSEMHVIHSGHKIMQLTVKDYNIRLIDSLNFLQMPLSKFPETFGLDKSKYSKGDFPFFYNNPENQNYVGPIPDIKYYSPDTKSEKDRSNLITWHKELCETNYVFDFQKEMYTYCSQDVTILRLCCIKLLVSHF
jgi:ferredoxin